jgi:hypothetical protein
MTRFELEQEIVDKLLELASLYDEVTTSDLQGIASVMACDIVSLVKLNEDK